MERIFVPIGSGCATATLLKQRNLRHQSLPFDWMLSHMDFVNTITKSLYGDPLNKTIELFLDTTNSEVYSILENHNDNTDRYVDDFGNVHEQKFEYHKTVSKDSGLPYHPYNRALKVSFPHDSINLEIAKYERRLNRFKDILSNPNNFISFVYISPSSEQTHYCIDNEPLTKNAAEKLNQFCEFLETKRSNFEVVFIDSLQENIILNHRIKKIDVVPYKNWFPMITKNKIEF